jgi:hypothetical protein
MPLRGILCPWQADHAHQPPSRGFVYVARGFSPGQDDAPATIRAITPGLRLKQMRVWANIRAGAGTPGGTAPGGNRNDLPPRR